MKDAKPSMERRISRIAGQVEGLRKMVASKRYCLDILTQVAAVRSALDALGVEILSSHLETCVLHRGKPSHAHKKALALSQKQLVDEVHTTLRRFLR